jgi:hypothetical protein
VLIGLLLLGAVFGLLAAKEAHNFQQKNGVAPWRLDPVLWGVIVFLTGLLIGGILLIIARRTTKPELPASVWSASATTGPVNDPAVAQPVLTTSPYAVPTTSPYAMPSPYATPTTPEYAAPSSPQPVSPQPLGRDILPGG